MDPTPSLPRSLERWLSAGLFAATLAALLLVALNGLAPRQRPLTFGLVLWLWHVGFALGLSLVGGVLSILVARALGRPALDRALLVCTALGVLVAALTGNGRAFAAAAGLPGPARFAWLVPLSIAASVVGLVAVACLRDRWRLLPRALVLAAVLAALVALWPPRGRAASGGAPRSGHARGGAPVVLVGVDGADWRYVDALAARGDLPHLAALKARGAWGDLGTFKPTLSPVVWTTVATGKTPKEHGIEAFATPRLGGVVDPLPQLQGTHRLGFRSLVALLQRWRVVEDGPVMSTQRRVPAYWNVATLLGSPVAVVNWWATWPAEPVLGAMVSERVYYRPVSAGERRVARVTYPEALADEIDDLVLRPEDVGLAAAREFVPDLTAEDLAAMKAGRYPPKSLGAQLPYFLAMHETDRRVARHLVTLGRKQYGFPPDLLVLFRLVDMTGHTSLQHSELVEDHLDERADDVRKYGRVVSQAYRAVDAALGDLIEAVGPDANVLVVSDHGFRLERNWPEWTPFYGHGQAPPGMFLAAGPAVRPGRVEGLTVLDVMPLLLALKGFPVADDLAGTLHEELLLPAFLAVHPVKRLASYGTRDALATGETSGVDAEMMERLRALGYVE